MWCIIGLIILVILVPSGDKNRKCAWCGGKKIKFENGKEGSWFWEYRNKDGSRDKRVKDNFEQASYTSTFTCETCSAKTQFNHFVSKKPNAKVKVWKRKLLNKGQNERTGTDWEDASATTIKKNEENRKNN